MEGKETQIPSMQPVQSETDAKKVPKTEKVSRRWGRDAKKDATDTTNPPDATEEDKPKEPNMDGSTVKNFVVRNYTPSREGLQQLGLQQLITFSGS
jgi:hypothetical protein